MVTSFFSIEFCAHRANIRVFLLILNFIEKNSTKIAKCLWNIFSICILLIITQLQKSHLSSKIMNAYDRVVDAIPRTTNACEGWHRAFNAANEVAHHNIARLIKKLQTEEDINRLSKIAALRVI